MMISCPHCGARDSGEFQVRGEVASRPLYGDGESAFADYVYSRTNVAGVQKEHWYHAMGCRNWLVVERDTRSHAVVSAVFARDMVR